ncbi:MAG: hypothetical protein EZS28_043290 [Streblomastix strix]|uniref:Uncharacterized protein n=1 Tax=Streblomastix strix TaxID=222440 RepID=A0A5J4TTE3_9EUKA|nr:MAG: hypothetical protein EZS28_043290 [Streblomastix strix]
MMDLMEANDDSHLLVFERLSLLLIHELDSIVIVVIIIVVVMQILTILNQNLFFINLIFILYQYFLHYFEMVLIQFE